MNPLINSIVAHIVSCNTYCNTALVVKDNIIANKAENYNILVEWTKNDMVVVTISSYDKKNVVRKDRMAEHNVVTWIAAGYAA